MCLGTMTFGQQNTEAEGHRQLDAAFERGVNFLDTAEIYPVKPAPETQGRTSEIVGSWLKSRPRDDVVLATKVAGRSTGLAWVPANRTVPRGAEATPVLDAASVRAGLEGELRRLRTDYVDLFQLHWPDRPVPAFGRNRYRRADAAPAPGAPPFASFEELVGEIGKLIAEGKVREVSTCGRRAGRSGGLTERKVGIVQRVDVRGVPARRHVRPARGAAACHYSEQLQPVASVVRGGARRGVPLLRSRPPPLVGAGWRRNLRGEYMRPRRRDGGLTKAKRNTRQAPRRTRASTYSREGTTGSIRPRIPAFTRRWTNTWPSPRRRG